MRLITGGAVLAMGEGGRGEEVLISGGAGFGKGWGVSIEGLDRTRPRRPLHREIRSEKGGFLVRGKGGRGRGRGNDMEVCD